jgi:hypothetical protein
VLIRTIWIYWDQGRAAAPFVVARCIDSWIRENPGWNVVVLDAESAHDYIEIDLPEAKLRSLAVQHLSDLIRLALLLKYGGVWADATTYCMRPLDDWIENCAASGFFAFSNPGPDRLISNWFLAAEGGNPLVRKLYNRLIAFWTDNDFPRPERRRDRKRRRNRIRFLSRLLNRNTKTTKYWFSPLITRVLKLHPYFVFHFQFERLVATDPEARAAWERMKKIPADAPRAARVHSLFAPPSDAMQAHIRDRIAPLYKLTWKYDPARYTPGTLLHYLLEGRPDQDCSSRETPPPPGPGAAKPPARGFPELG